MDKVIHHHPHTLSLRMPTWLADMPQLIYETTYPSIESRMALAIKLARNNIDHGSGGPFGAAIFDRDNYQLIAVGVNVVVQNHCSMAHAEMMAISLTQQKLASFDLSSSGQDFELVSSCEPCAMCFGAIPWSGIQHLICGARDADARAIGFDEGPKMDHWQIALEERGISVQRDVCRQDAINLFSHYVSLGGTIYNAGSNL